MDDCQTQDCGRVEGALVITDLETLKVLTDPLRHQILELLIPASGTVGDVAARLGMAPSRLYYHVNLLEQHGLIQVVRTVQKGNILEKHYRAAAAHFKLQEGLLNFGTPADQGPIGEVLLAPLDATRDDLRRSLEARAYNLQRGAPVHPRNVTVRRDLSRLTDEQADAFHAQLQALIDEFVAADLPADAPDSQFYALTVALYPSFYYQESEDAAGSDEEPAGPGTTGAR